MAIDTADTLLVDGLELPSSVCLEWPYEWPYQAVEDAGEAITYPGLDGGLPGGSLYPPSVLAVPMTISTGDDCEDTLSAANARLLEVRAALKPGREVTLTKRLSRPEPDAPLDLTARARLVSMPTTRAAVDVFRAVAEFMLLDGVWYGPEVTIAPGAAVEVLGDTRTHRMTITLTGATDVTLTNHTNGWSLTFAGTDCIIENESIAVTSGNPANLSWKKRLPFRLDPGPNNITVSAGSASIAYRPAYL